MHKKEVASCAVSLCSDSMSGKGGLNLQMYGDYSQPQRPPWRNAAVKWSSGCRRLQWLVRYSGSDIPQERVIGGCHFGGGLSSELRAAVDWLHLVAPGFRRRQSKSAGGEGARFKLAGDTWSVAD